MSSEPMLREFVRSMPTIYGERFAADAIRKHAHIVLARNGAAAHADIWEVSPGARAGICVVADERPGLLSLVSTALVRHDLDVNAAQIYARALPNGGLEAVDLFWVSRRGHDALAPERSDIQTMGRALASLIERAPPPPNGARRSSVAKVVPPGDKARRVRFAFDAEEAATVLIVEAADRTGLLLAITRALFELGTQVVRCDVLTIRGRAVDRFHVTEPDGQPLSPVRRAEVEHAIEQVLDQPFARALQTAKAP